MGKRLLQHERASQTGVSLGGRATPLEDIARKYVGEDGKGRIADSDLRARMIRHIMDARVHSLTL
ncbi:MAG: acyl-CoA dehydrogenase, partial [Phenylobacterium sp.]